MERMELRKASPADIRLIRDLSLEVWPQTYQNILSPDQVNYMLEMMYSEESLRRQMAGGHEFVILLVDGRPEGFASLSPSLPGTWKLHKIYVLPSQQGKGAGKFIIRELVRDLSAKKAVALQLNVNRQNPAKIFYEKLGFAVVGEEDIDIGGGYFMNDYVMELRIDPDGYREKMEN